MLCLCRTGWLSAAVVSLVVVLTPHPRVCVRAVLQKSRNRVSPALLVGTSPEVCAVLATAAAVKAHSLALGTVAALYAPRGHPTLPPWLPQDREAEALWDARFDKSPSRFNDKKHPLLRAYF